MFNESFTRLGDLKTVFFTVEEMMLGGFYPYPTYFENITGSPDYFNLLVLTRLPPFVSRLIVR